MPLYVTTSAQRAGRIVHPPRQICVACPAATSFSRRARPDRVSHGLHAFELFFGKLLRNHILFSTCLGRAHESVDGIDDALHLPAIVLQNCRQHTGIFADLFSQFLWRVLVVLLLASSPVNYLLAHPLLQRSKALNL